ncbi:MAG: TlpA disulfide reductase family protein [Balneolales bacterium]
MKYFTIDKALLGVGALFLTISCTTLQSGGGTGPDGTKSNVPEHFITAPDFRMTTMDGSAFRLSDHEGEVVVLNIWATWCMPCRKEIPDFIEIQDEMRDDGVIFLGVSIDEDGWHVVRPFAEEYNINYPLVVDDGKINRGYGPFPGIPTTFVINKEREIEYVASGAVSSKTLKPILQELADR